MIAPSCSFPFRAVKRIWDIFLYEREKVPVACAAHAACSEPGAPWQIVFRVGLTLLKESQDRLLEREFEGLMEFLKHGQAFRAILRDPDLLIEKSLELPLKRSQVEDARRAYSKQ